MPTSPEELNIWNNHRKRMEIKNSSNCCEMDTEIKMKQEDCSSDDLASQNEGELFRKVITVKSNSNAVPSDDNGCDMDIKTEIKSETLFPEFEAVTCRNNCEIVTKAEVEQALDSGFSSQKGTQFLSEDPLIKTKNYNSNHEMDIKIEIKAEPWWLETETSSVCNDIKDEDFPPVTSSRLHAEAVSSAVSGKSPLSPVEISGSFCKRKVHLEFEHQESDVTEVPTAEEHALSEQSAKCSKICDKSFAQLPNFKICNMIHEAKKLYQCTICGKSFTQLSHLKAHNLIHEGKKPHRCKTCDKSFTQMSDLNKHYLIHEGKKPHQCKICDKSFTQLSNLKIHNLIHEGKKPHQCTICGKSFTQLSHLRTHNLIHEGEKRHQCKTCDKTFARLSNLKRHYLIHK